jgi:undecaprenyl diphosphate synthase
MDGNGRWAESRGLPRAAGHRNGVEAARGIIRCAPDLGIGTLTLYAFSADNWQRPETEVRALMWLLREYLRTATPECVENGVRLRVIGRRDRLPITLMAGIEKAEEATAAGRKLQLRVAIDYAAREAIVRAARALAGESDITRERFAAALGAVTHGGGPAPDLDLLVRSGGERRLSDFLLWEAAYAELWFSDVLWPDFKPSHLAEAVRWYHHRERRFGRVPAATTRPAAGA